MRVGVDKTAIDINPEEMAGVGFMGYGAPENYLHPEAKHETPYVRTIAMEDEAGGRHLWVNIEAQGPGNIVRMKLWHLLNEGLEPSDPAYIHHEQLTVIANHTHSMLGGDREHSIYNATVPGYQPRVADLYARTMAESVRKALGKLQPGVVQWERAYFNDDAKDERVSKPTADTGGNRSILAYLAAEGLDIDSHWVIRQKRMQDAGNYKRHAVELMVVKDLKHEILGMMNWIDVHATSVRNTNQAIDTDNKGELSRMAEEDHGLAAVVASNPGMGTGDVSPNRAQTTGLISYHPDWERGMFEKDDFKSKRRNAREQLETLYHGLKQLKYKNVDEGKIKQRSVTVRMDGLWVRPEYRLTTADGRYVYEGERVSGPALGRAFTDGTPVDGRGEPLAGKALVMLSHLTGVDKDMKAEHGSKQIVVDGRNQQLAGLRAKTLKNTLGVLLSPTPDEPYTHDVARELGYMSYFGGLEETEYLPQEATLQLVQVGEQYVLTLPFELTTQAGRVLLEQTAKKLGVEDDRVLIVPYANGYNGYVTTPSEYEVQQYEGGHTLYGPNTLGGICTVMAGLVDRLQNDFSLTGVAKDISEPKYADPMKLKNFNNSRYVQSYLQRWEANRKWWREQREKKMGG